MDPTAQISLDPVILPFWAQTEASSMQKNRASAQRNNFAGFATPWHPALCLQLISPNLIRTIAEFCKEIQHDEANPDH
jgi:hypothetical protein